MLRYVTDSGVSRPGLLGHYCPVHTEDYIHC